MKKKTVILAMALCMMGATAAMAQRNNGQQGGRPDNSQRIERMVKELSLDDAKAKEFRAVMESMQPTAGNGERPSREEMQKKREEVDKKVKAILSEEQYKKYQQLNQQRGGGRKDK